MRSFGGRAALVGGKKNLTAWLPSWELQITAHSVQSVLYLDLWGDNSRSYKGTTCDLARLTSLLRRIRRAEEKQHVHNPEPVTKTHLQGCFKSSLMSEGFIFLQFFCFCFVLFQNQSQAFVGEVSFKTVFFFFVSLQQSPRDSVTTSFFLNLSILSPVKPIVL